MNYINYHCHTQYSNINIPDSTISNRDRAIRAFELGQTVLSGLEHGWGGRFIEIIELAKEFNLKPLFGVESYFVKNRMESDKTNAHLVILAKNENGRKSINRILSEANISGFYYKPRVDLELLLSLPSEDVWITTACIGGIWKYDNYQEILRTLYTHFQNNLFLEVQNHPTNEQKKINHIILELSKVYNIKLIAGMDSHMISIEQSRERDNYLLSRGIEYPDEVGWILDYPDYNEAFLRFEQQGILNKRQIEIALENTNIFESVEPYNSIIFDSSNIKLPTLFPAKSQKEKDEILSNLVWTQWQEEKKNISQDKYVQYENEIKKELGIIFKTKMSDYFLLDYEVIKKGKEIGGQITLTGRGSAPSFYLSKLLGFTTIDRISATVKLFPERFISAERLLETKNLPDIDFNLGNPEVFAEAQEYILGKGHSYPMIAFGTVRTLGAWKIFARVSGIDFETASLVSEQIQNYEMDLKHGEDEERREEINVLNYIDEKYHTFFLESKKYLGLVNTLTPHPCAYLMFNEGDIREEFGLIKIKTGGVEHICVCCDGLFAENYKLLKNDLLKVNVVKIIYETYKKIGIQPQPLPQLLEICSKDKKVWDIYKNAWTMGINQVEQTGTSGRVAKYAPKNISELSAFVAAIRPGFQSNYRQFEAREPFCYGVKSLDDLIQTKEFPQSYLIYQENAMQVMAYAGIPISETYEIIKNIAKKRVEKVLKYEKKFVSGMISQISKNEPEVKNPKEVAETIWKIIEDSSRYSFNSSHAYSVAGDSLYGAWLKSNYPFEFYETLMQMLEEDGDKDKLKLVKEEAERAFGIRFPKFKFGQDNRAIVSNKKNGEITSSLKTLKGFGSLVGESMFELSNKFDGGDFVALLIFAEENGYFSSKWEILIKIGYFEKFGKNKKLLTIYEEFKKGKNRYNKKLTNKSKEKRIVELYKIFYEIQDEPISFIDQVEIDLEIFGQITSTFPIHARFAYVTDLQTKMRNGSEIAPRTIVYGLKNGNLASLKIYKATFKNNPFEIGDILFCDMFSKKNPIKMENGKWIETEVPDNQKQFWLDKYQVFKPMDFFKIFKTT